MELRAVIIYLRTRDLPRAYRHCSAHHYEVEALVHASRFEDAVQLVTDGRAQVIVAASEDALSPDRVPRAEVADPDVGLGTEPRPKWHRRPGDEPGPAME